MLLLILGCTPKPAAAEPESEAPSSSSGAKVANPASQNCESKGGHVEIVDGPKGQSGVCIFADGSRCEEFRFMRGTCEPGSCQNPDGVCD